MDGKRPRSITTRRRNLRSRNLTVEARGDQSSKESRPSLAKRYKKFCLRRPASTATESVSKEEDKVLGADVDNHSSHLYHHRSELSMRAH